MEISITLNHIQAKLNLFPRNWGDFHIDQIKGILVKRYLEMLGLVQKSSTEPPCSTLLPELIKKVIMIRNALYTLLSSPLNFLRF